MPVKECESFHEIHDFNLFRNLCSTGMRNQRYIYIYMCVCVCVYTVFQDTLISLKGTNYSWLMHKNYERKLTILFEDTQALYFVN